MYSIEIWYLWYIFYTKFVYILCKFYLVQSFDYSWNNNLIMLLCKRNICFILENFVLLLSHFLVISTANISKVVSMLFSQRWSNADEQTQLSFSTKYKSWNSIDLSTLNQRNSFNVVSTLFYQRWNNVDKHTSAQLSFSTKFQRWNIFYRRWIYVILSTLFQRCFANVETTSINVRRLNFHFQPNINVKTTLMNVDNQRWCVCWDVS